MPASSGLSCRSTTPIGLVLAVVLAAIVVGMIAFLVGV